MARNEKSFAALGKLIEDAINTEISKKIGSIAGPFHDIIQDALRDSVYERIEKSLKASPVKAIDIPKIVDDSMTDMVEKIMSKPLSSIQKDFKAADTAAEPKKKSAPRISTDNGSKGSSYGGKGSSSSTPSRSYGGKDSGYGGKGSSSSSSSPSYGGKGSSYGGKGSSSSARPKKTPKFGGKGGGYGGK